MSDILIVDDDIAGSRTLQLHFRSQDYAVAVAHSVDEGLVAVAASPPKLIILDIRMPGRDGLQSLPEFKQLCPNTPVIMITAFHDMDSTIQAMQRGADDYIHKPIDINELDEAISKVLMRRETSDDDLVLKHEETTVNGGINTMVGRSRAMREVFKTIGMVAATPVTVLITGESGTGKELVARAIHKANPSQDGPFVSVNCAALVETLLESDLFGHKKGAFTGAINRHRGKFELAANGTIFLDEIGELSPAVQAKLLRVLQEREFVPVGGTQVQSTNARIIAATNVDLQEQVVQGAFREDLYYRLQVVTIHVPPLRERKEDLLDLAQVLLARINQELHRKVTHLAMDVTGAFLTYDWPGNVRELENVLTKAVALCPGEIITRDFIPDILDKSRNTVQKSVTQLSLCDVEKEHVTRVLAATSWHRGQACEILGVSRPRLRRLINQYGLTPAGDGSEADVKVVEEEDDTDRSLD